MASIVDPAVQRGGAWTVTRGIVTLLQRAAPNAGLTIAVPREPSWRRLRQAGCLALARLTGIPAKVHFLRERSFRKEMGSILARNQFDLVIINGSDLLWCINEVPAEIPTVVVVHNCESQLFADQAATSIPRIGSLQNLFSAEAARLLDFELEGLRRAKAAIFLSDDDARDFSHRIPGLFHMVLPPQFIDAPQRLEKVPSGFLDLGFLSNFNWWPNREGANWFIREILDKLPDHVRLHLFGIGSTKVTAPHPRIITHGFTEDLRQVWKKSDWMIIPIRYGSGVSVKAAESLYHGMPLISTDFGLRGLPVEDLPQIVRCETPAEWVAFLSSGEAHIRCRERLPPEASTHFDPGLNLSRFTHFLAGITPLAHCNNRLTSPSIAKESAGPVEKAPGPHYRLEKSRSTGT